MHLHCDMNTEIVFIWWRKQFMRWQSNISDIGFINGFSRFENNEGMWSSCNELLYQSNVPSIDVPPRRMMTHVHRNLIKENASNRMTARNHIHLIEKDDAVIVGRLDDISWFSECENRLPWIWRQIIIHQFRFTWVRSLRTIYMTKNRKFSTLRFLHHIDFHFIFQGQGTSLTNSSQLMVF